MTRGGDVYVTDSFRPTLWHVTGEQVEAGSGAPQALDVSGIPYEAEQFNVNGIVAKGRSKLVVVDSNSGKLFRIKLGDEGGAIEDLDEITAPRCWAATACCSTAASSVVQGDGEAAVVPEAQARRARGGLKRRRQAAIFARPQG